MIKPILLLGNPELYKVSEPVYQNDIQLIEETTQNLHDTMMEFRRVHGLGRAIAAPQIGVRKRIIYMNLDGRETVFVNPELVFENKETYRLWDDCMSFPGLYVFVERYKECEIRYVDKKFKRQSLSLSGDLSELIQHEYDHLDGILAVQRAVDDQSLSIVKPG